MTNSARLGWPFPNTEDWNWFDAFAGLVNAIDGDVFTTREDRNLILTGGGTFTFNASTGVLSWSQDMRILATSTGFFWLIVAGSVTIPDGSLLYVQLVRNPLVSMALTPVVGTQAPMTGGESRADTLLLAVRNTTFLYWRNGARLADGDSRSLFAGGASLPVATGVGQTVVSTGPGTTYVAQPQITSGLAAARPVASAQLVGTQYYATDTSVLYECIVGPMWVAVLINPTTTGLAVAQASSPAVGLAALNGVSTTDSRLSDARMPVAHASTHATVGSDPISPAAIGADVVGAAAAVAARTLTGTAPLTVAGDNAPHDLTASRTLALTLSGSSLEVATGGLRVGSALAGAGLTGGGASPLAVAYGTASSTAAQGNDVRLPPAPGTQGRILYDSGSAWTALDTGTAGNVLQTAGAGANPLWGPVALAPGLDAARPAASAGIVGQTYYATDTGITYLCVTAATWVILVGAPRRVPKDANDVLVWTLDEPSGSFANSGSGSAYALAIQTVAARDPSGIHGGCVSVPLTGHGALVGTGSGPALPTTGVSVSFWIRPRSIQPYGRLVEKSFDAATWASPYSSLGADWNSGSPWRAWVTTGTTQRFVTAPSSPVLNVWHHFGWTYDGTTLVMYVDGDAVASAAYTGTIAYGTTPGPWAIGNTNTALTGTADQPSDSRFDDVRIANVTRPASYFAAMWSRGKGYGAP